MQYFSFQWHITEECDQRCKHCYIFSDNNSKKIDIMSWDQIKKTLENCEKMCQTFGLLPYMYITGGDPVLHKDFWQLAELLKSKNIPFTIMGNPFHLTEEVCRKLKNYGCVRYQLSLDGMRETHDWFRKQGSFDITLEKIETIKSAGIRAIIMTTVSDKNIHEIPDIIDTVVKYHADVFAFSRYVPCGKNDTNGISPQQYRDLLDKCFKKFRYYEENGCKTYFNRKDHLWTLYEYEQGIFKIPDNAPKGMIYGGCNCGNCHITILPTGDVYACRRVADSKVGNVFKDDLSNIWLDPMEEYREYDKFSKCSKCRLLPYCRGCPAVAKGTYGNFYEKDPQCWADENGNLFL